MTFLKNGYTSGDARAGTCIKLIAIQCNADNPQCKEIEYNKVLKQTVQIASQMYMQADRQSKDWLFDISYSSLYERNSFARSSLVMGRRLTNRDWCVEEVRTRVATYFRTGRKTMTPIDAQIKKPLAP